MLNALRNLARTWIGKILGAFLIVGLAGFGISNVLFTLGANTVASVGGEDISVRDFQRAYESQVNAFSQQTGRLPTSEEAAAFGIVDSVIVQLTNDAAVNQMGKNLGLGVSDARLAKLVRQDPSFANALGNFDRASFSRVLQQSGYTEAEYLELQAKAARRQQLVSGLLADPPTPSAASELLSRYSSDRRTVDYFVLNTAFLPPVDEPTEADLEAYLTEHQSTYRTQETRIANVLALSPEVLAESIEIGDDVVAEEYERTKESRQKVERRTVGQVALNTPELVTLFEEGLENGTSFAELLQQSGATAESLGTLAKSDITNTTLADAAFSTDAGQFTIIDGIGGKRAITVTNIEPGGQIALEDVRDEIAQSLALRQARDQYTDILDQIEELRAAFRPLDEIATRFELAPTEVTLTADGEALGAVDGLPEEDRSRVATAIFGADVGDLAPTIALGSNRNVWFDLQSVEPARDQTLDEVREQVVAEWTAEKETEALTAEVADLEAKYAAGTSFEDLAAAAGQVPQLSQPMGRGGLPGTEIDSAVATEIFAGGPNHFGAAMSSNGNQVVFKVADIIPGEGTDAQAEKFVADTTLETLYAEFITGVKADAGPRVNTGVISQTLGLDQQQ